MPRSPFSESAPVTHKFTFNKLKGKGGKPFTIEDANDIKDFFKDIPLVITHNYQFCYKVLQRAFKSVGACLDSW